MQIDEFFEELFGYELEALEYAHHPDDEVLSAYLRGRLRKAWQPPESPMARSGEWRHREVSVHLLTCPSCRRRMEALKEARERLSRWAWAAKVRTLFQERVAAVPRAALATIAVESLIILGLFGLLLLQAGVPLLKRAPADITTAPTASQESEEPVAAESLPQPALQAIETLNSSPDPQVRLAAAEQLQQWASPQLVEPLTQVYERESHPKVKEALAQTLSSIWAHTEGQTLTVARALQRFREKSRQDFDFLRSRFGLDIEKVLDELNELHSGLWYPRTFHCFAQGDLTLNQLSELTSQINGRLLIDRSFSPGSFQLRLPPSSEMTRIIDRLRSQLGISCQR